MEENTVKPYQDGMKSNASLIYKVCYLFAERNFDCLVSFFDMSDNIHVRYCSMSHVTHVLVVF